MTDMNENGNDLLGFNRRDFLKGGSVATLMTMLGGVELLSRAEEEPGAETKPAPGKVKVAVIGLGSWGREILNNLGRLPRADVVAICDTYPAFMKRASTSAPAAAQTADYKTVLANQDIKAVIIATPTHQHKEIVLEALKAGKHVYCEAPLANTIEDARVIALAAKAAKQSVFQAGLQLRADPERHYVRSFIRSGAIGEAIMARAQWHKKQSWRAASANPEKEKALNWRLDKALSLGLIGEMGAHQIDEVSWYMNAMPVAITGFGSVRFWKDGREVPDTIQAMIEYPGGVFLSYDASLANSFDADYEVFYGSDAAIMMRESKAWLFKEADSPLLGWEVYASKESFYHETGIVLQANASKSVKEPKKGAEVEITNPILLSALEVFLHNVFDVEVVLDAVRETFKDDPEAINEQVSGVKKRPAAGYLEGFQATVSAIKANEAVVSAKRIELKPELYELG
jgi:predicted dehydrogenase